MFESGAERITCGELGSLARGNVSILVTVIEEGEIDSIEGGPGATGWWPETTGEKPELEAKQDANLGKEKGESGSLRDPNLKPAGCRPVLRSGCRQRRYSWGEHRRF